MLARVALFALLAVLSVFGAVAQTATYTLCYQLEGLPHETLDDPYSIAVLVTGTYNTTTLTSVAGKYTPAGTYHLLLSGTGTRTIRTRNNKNVTYTITSLEKAGSDYSDNRFYLSNATQFVDADGLTFNLSTNAQFPGKQFSTFWNVYRSGVYGAVLEDKTSGLDLTKFALSANIAGFTGPAYVAGSCVPQGLEATATPAVKPATAVYTITVNYNISSTPTETPAWNVLVSAVLKTDGVTYGPDAYGDYWFQLNTAAGQASGTRKYTISGTTTTSSITAAAPIGTYGFVDNRVYTYAPYFDYNGIGYTLATAQAKPGFAQGTNTTTTVNPYVTKGGVFIEGFGSGGTGPNGAANALTDKFTVAITH